MPRIERNFEQMLRNLKRDVVELKRTSQASLVGYVDKETGKIKDTLEDLNVDVRSPAAPVEVVTDFYVHESYNGKRREGYITITSAPVTKATDGSDIQVSKYEMWARSAEYESGSEPPFELQSSADAPSLRSLPVEQYKPYEVVIRALTPTGRSGMFSEVKTVTVTDDDSPPPVPSQLILSQRTGVIIMEWDGLSFGDTLMPLDFWHTEVGVRSGEEAEYTLIGESFEEAGLSYYAKAPFDVSVYVSHRSVDYAGNVSEWAQPSTIVVEKVVDDEALRVYLDEVEKDIDQVSQDLADSRQQLQTNLDAMQVDLDSAEANLTNLKDVVIPGVNSRLDQAEADIVTSGNELNSRLDTAFVDIGTAQGTADSALTMAGSKNTVMYSYDPPSGTATTGDTWRQVISNGDVVAEWRWTSGGSWLSQRVTSDMVSNLDVGKLTASTATISTAVVDKLWAEVVTARKIMASQLLIGAMDNLIPNPSFENLGQGWRNDTGSASVGVFETNAASRSGESRFVVTGYNGSFDGAYHDMYIPVTSGEEFRIGVYYKIANGTGAAGFRVYDYDAKQGYIRSKGFYTEETTGNNWGHFEATYKANPDAHFIRVRLYGRCDTTDVSVIFDDIAMHRKADGSLVVKGSITGDHVNANSVAAAVGQFIDLDVSQLTASSASISSAVVDKLWADVIHAKKITTEMLAIGSFGNLIPDPNFETGDTTEVWWNSIAGPGEGISSEIVHDSESISILMPVFDSARSNASLYARFLTPEYLIPVIPGESYRVTSWVYLDASSVGSLSAVDQRVYHYATRDGAILNSRAGESNVPNPPVKTWFEVGGIFTVPDGTYFMTPRLTVHYPQNGTATPSGARWFISPPKVVRASGGELIVDGAVNAKHITASQSLSAKVGQFLEVKAGMIKANAVTTATIKAGAITAVKIAASTITGDKLAANTITAGKIAANAITASELAADSVRAVNIKAGQVTTAKIAAGAVTAKEIAAGTITADKMIVGFGANLMPDPTYSNLDIDRYTGNGWDTYISGGGVRAFRLRGESGYFEPFGRSTQAYSGGDTTNWIPCNPGEEYKFTVDTYGSGYTRWRSYATFLLSDGTYSGYYPSYETTHGTKSIEFTIPADVLKFSIRCRIDNPAGGGGLGFYGRNSGLWLKTGGDLIVNGAITADKLDADAITGKKITGGTITGATLQTATSGARIVVNSSGVSSYTSGGNIGTKISNGNAVFWSNDNKGFISMGATTSFGGNAMILFKRDGNSRSGSIIAGDPYSNGGPYMNITPPMRSGDALSGIKLESRPYSEGGAMLSIDAETINLGPRRDKVTRRPITFKAGILGTSDDVIWKARRLKLYGGELTKQADLILGNDSRSSYVQSKTAYNRTYSSSHAMCITGSGVFGRLTSALKYKEDVELVDPASYEDALLGIEHKSWVDKAEASRYREYLEWEAEHPMQPIPQEMLEAPTAPPKRHYGAIADEFHDAGLGQFVVYDANGEVDALAYDRVGVALLPVVKRLRERVVSLEDSLSDAIGRLDAAGL